MKHFLLSIILALSSSFMVAQEVQKQILLEHFTNTYCSTCAGVNPNFYNEIDGYNEVVHVAYHPSSPYAGCPLSQHNAFENDARTNYYNIYGSTPKVVMNGSLVPFTSTLVTSSSLNAAQMETSPFSIEINQYEAGSDSMYVEISINTVAPNAIASANLVVLLGEKVLNFNAQNGENVHYDVFRKFLNQTSVSLPANGSSSNFTFGSRFDQEWTPSELTTTVILQESNQNVLQSKQSDRLDYTTGIATTNIIEDAIYPNPAKNFLTINNESQLLERVEIYNIIGSKMKEIELKGNAQLQVPISDFERGSYIVRIYDQSNKVFTRKVVFSN